MKNPNYDMRHFEVEAALREIGELIKKKTPAGFGFSLLMFQYGEGGAMFYLSSAERADMIKAMKEFIQKNEK
jgi:hypothetical protein